ncbi:unnamed protein product [Linum trigynum]|uniref:Reverse transcriptase zinc-binding domain-containing protein n=1 Tax=Linum trigynum TaxID=586398 RepID=A0AAV2EUD2_9ROSI
MFKNYNELNARHPPDVLAFDCRLSKILWNLPLPPKLKFFFWRVVRGFLPLQSVLLQKTLVTSPTCPVCSDAPETFNHCFFHCRVAQPLWTLAGLADVRSKLEGLPMDDAWNNLLLSLRLSKLQVAEVVFLCWRIWKGRCWAVHGGIQYLPPALLRQFRLEVDEWRAASLGPSTHSGGSPSPVTGIPRSPSPTTTGVIASRVLDVRSAASQAWLVRFDGATKRARGCSVGFVGFDSLGGLTFAFGKFYPDIQDPFLAELLAFRDAMDWCLTRGFLSVKFVGDSQLVVRHVFTDERQHAMGGALLEDVHRMVQGFEFCSCSYAKRIFNRAAHFVAKQALSSEVRLLVDFRTALSSVL